jgi:hypothetical protein
MATLRELRGLAKEMEIPYEKKTSKADLENLIAEKMASLGIDAEETPKAPVEKAPVKGIKEETPKTAFGDAIKIDPMKLNNEFMTQSANYYHFAKLEGVASAEIMEAKLTLETVEADLYKSIRSDFADKGVKATEKMIATEITEHEKYLVARKGLIKATSTHSIAKAARDAFIQRKDMLIQLGLSKRQENAQEVTIMHENAKKVVNG